MGGVETGGLRGQRSRSGVEPRVWKEPTVPRQQGTQWMQQSGGGGRPRWGDLWEAFGCWMPRVGWGFPLLPASWIRDVGTARDAAGALQQAWWEAIVSPLGKKGSGAWQRT